MDNFSDIARSTTSTNSDSGTLDMRVEGYNISENATILEEGLRVCPLCQTELKLFILNYEEKVLMCENVECDYPFYEENFPIYRTDSEICSISKYSRSKKILEDTSATCSIASTSWSDVERITRALDSDFTPSEYRLKNREKISDQKEKVQKLLQSRDYIKNLTNQMKEINKIGRVKRITNNKYIKNLMNLQSMTGAKMLEPEEMKVVEKDTSISQLKVNLDLNPENSVSCIKIELVDITKEENRRVEKETISTT